MLNIEEAVDRCADLVARARAFGADAADAVHIGSISQSVEMRLGALENLDRSEAEHFGLRVFCGRRSATIGSSAIDSASLDELASRAVAMALTAPDDPDAGLAPEHLLLCGPSAELDLVSPPPTADELREAALCVEDAARAVTGITNSEGASAGYGENTLVLVTSHGFARGYRRSHQMRAASMIAGEGARMQRGSSWRVARHGEDLPADDWLGRQAASRAVERLDPGSLASGPMPVLFDPRVGGTLLGHLVSAISGPAVARRATFLLDEDGKTVFAPTITITDDPLRPRGIQSHPFDGEGLPCTPRAIVDQGVLTGWLMDSASARKLGRQPTGHAVRSGGGAPGVSASNLELGPGDGDRDALIADIREGVLVTELIGHGINGVTGDYSRGASGFRITNGEIAGPVAGFTIAGNLRNMYRNMSAANDLEHFRAINVPTLRVDGMTVAGA